MTTTLLLLASRPVTEAKMEMRTAVVDPVGRNAYWLEKVSEDGGERKAGE